MDNRTYRILKHISDNKESINNLLKEIFTDTGLRECKNFLAGIDGKYAYIEGYRDLANSHGTKFFDFNNTRIEARILQKGIDYINTMENNNLQTELNKQLIEDLPDVKKYREKGFIGSKINTIVVFILGLITILVMFILAFFSK